MSNGTVTDQKLTIEQKQKLYDKLMKVADEVTALVNAMTPEELKTTFTIERFGPFIKDTAKLIEYADWVRKRGRLPKHAARSILMDVATQKGFLYSERIGLFCHLSKIESFKEAILHEPTPKGTDRQDNKNG